MNNTVTRQSGSDISAGVYHGGFGSIYLSLAVKFKDKKKIIECR